MRRFHRTIWNITVRETFGEFGTHPRNRCESYGVGSDHEPQILNESAQVQTKIIMHKNTGTEICKECRNAAGQVSTGLARAGMMSARGNYL